ncbi:MAG: S8 family serine peptidase [Polyangiaceae bacterium]
MGVSIRCTMQHLGKWLPGVMAAAGTAACSSPSGESLNPARAFVETPSGRHVEFATQSASSALQIMAPELAVPDEPFVIAKFSGPVTPAAKAALRRAGYREVAYLPYDALLLERPIDAKGVAVAGMVALAPYQPEDRIARDLLPSSIALRTSRADVPVMIHVMPGHDRAAIRAAAAAKGGRIAGDDVAGAFGRVTAIFPVDQVATASRDLAELPSVFLLERIHHVGWLNDRTAGTIQSGVQGHDMGQTPIWEHGIRGEGQIVGMADTGLDANSCYFNGDKLPVTNTWSTAGGYGTLTDPTHRKIVAYDFLYSCDQWPMGPSCEDPNDHTKWDTQGHGTHVAGNMVGDSDSNPATFANQDGMAPAAKIVVQDAGFLANACSDGPGFGCPVMKLDPLFEQARLQGASVHNNSWGDNEDVNPPLQCNYTARSQDVDRYIWEHKDFLIVYAAGNEGTGNVDFSVGSPSTNKNGLSIGSTRTNATSSDENISRYSSRGWTSDGRIKPDLMVPGYNTAATNDRTVDGTVNCGASGGGGTSYAAPVAVAAAALVRQYYVDGFYPTGAKTAANSLKPTAALLKATMINSAVSMTGTDNAGQTISPIPSNEQGWGRVQLDRALLFEGSARKLYVDDHTAGIEAGSTTPITYTINAVDASQPLKITLVWTDYEGTPDSPPAAGMLGDSSTWNAARLVNDLNLSVTGPNGLYIGNVFAEGNSTMGGEADSRNNVEQVLLAAPTAGNYSVTVTPKSIMQGPQDFALVVTGAWSNVNGSTPPGGDASSPEGGTGGSGTGGSSGAGGAGTGGAGTAGAGTGGAGADGAGTGGADGDRGGDSCSCSIGKQSPTTASAWLLLAMAPIAALRRHRSVGRRGRTRRA